MEVEGDVTHTSGARQPRRCCIGAAMTSAAGATTERHDAQGGSDQSSALQNRCDAEQQRVEGMGREDPRNKVPSTLIQTRRLHIQIAGSPRHRAGWSSSKALRVQAIVYAVGIDLGLGALRPPAAPLRPTPPCSSVLCVPGEGASGGGMGKATHRYGLLVDAGVLAAAAPVLGHGRVCNVQGLE